MIRSLYSAVSGLTSHQTKMDVIGNNIANVNTYGFKSSRASFSDVYYQTLKSETAGTTSFAGNNPSTVGYGVQVASIDKDMSQGSFQSTNRTMDIALSGDGFFALGNFSSGPNGAPPALNTSPDQLTYSRSGNFGIDSFGNIVSNNNKFVMGMRNTKEGLHLIGSNSAQVLAEQELQDNNGDQKVTSADYTYENTINVNDLIREAYGIYTDNDKETKPTGFLYTNRKPEPVVKTHTDKDGNKTYEVVGFNQGEEDPDGKLYLCDIKGNYITKESQPDTTTTPPTTYLGVIEFKKEQVTNAAGVLEWQNSYELSFALPYADVEGEFGVVAPDSVDNTTTPYTYELTTITKDPASTATGTTITLQAEHPTEADGVIGEFTYKDLSSFTIGVDGVITVSYNNKLKAIARIEVTVFDNPEGLIENGDTSYSETPSSGAGGVKKAGEEGAGKTISKKLEMSNVNLAQEFSDMIVTQRGFQANARMVTTSDSMLEELVNLKR